MLRNVTGLVLAVYIATHLFNHALGVISIDAQDGLLEVLAPVWQSVPGTVVLYGSLIVHALLGLYALWVRKTLRMPTWELAQLVFGLAVPLLLIPHVFGTRVIGQICDVDQEWLEIGKQGLGGEFRFHLRVATQHDVFVQQATRECFVVSDVDLFVAV